MKNDGKNAKSINRFLMWISKLVFRVFIYLLISLILPFIVKMVKKKILENQQIRCNQCHTKLKVINKNEYYCKNCKTIRMDTN